MMKRRSQTMPRRDPAVTRKQELERELERQLALEAAQETVRKKKENGGTLPRNHMNVALKRLGCESLNRDKVNYEVRLLERKAPEADVPVVGSPAPPVSVTDDQSAANVSQLTSPSESVSTTGSESASTRRKGG